MSSLAFWASSDQFLVWGANVLLQVTLVTAVALVIAAFVRRSPAARHWVLCSSLLLALLSPAIALLMQLSGRSLLSVSLMHEAAASASDAGAEASPFPTPLADSDNTRNLAGGFAADDPAPFLSDHLGQENERLAELGSEIEGTSVSPAPEQTASQEEVIVASAAPQRTATRIGKTLRAAMGPILFVWLAGTVFLLGRLAIGWGRFAAILRSARPNTNASLAESFEQVGRALRPARMPELVLSKRVPGPLSVGVLHPRVVLPEWMVDRVTRRQLRDILVHEVAHIVRHDQVVVLLQNLAATIFWLHPLAGVLNRQLARAREEVCDNYVLTTTDAPSYSRTLLRLVELVETARPLPEAVGLFTSCWKLERRVAGLLDERRSRVIRLTTRAKTLGVAASLVLATIAALATMTPVVQSDAAAPADGSVDGPNDDSPQDANQGQPFRFFDSFDGKLELGWGVIRPDPNHVSLDKNPGRLTITSQRGGFHQIRGRKPPDLPAKNVHVIPNPVIGGGDFVVTTCLELFHPEAPFQQAGPCIYHDDDNYLKAIIARSEMRVIIGCSWETRGEFGGRDLNATDIEWDRLWLRIIKRGSAYESSFSLDGKEYTVIAERVWGDGSPPRIGLAVINEQATSAPLDAAFDFFEVRSLTNEEKNDPIPLERQKLQGTWEVVSSRFGGMATEKSLWSRFEFDGIEVTVSEEGQRITSKYALHPEKQPKGLALTALGHELWKNHTRAFEQDRNLMNAVYSIEQDRLVICMDPRLGVPAPTELETKDGDGRLLVELRRVSKVKVAALRRNSRSAKQLVDWLDVDHDEQLTLDEFTSDWPTPAAAARARQVFEFVDQDKDGRVTIEEYGKRPHQATFLLLDLDLDEKLTFDELSSGPLGNIPPNRRRRIFELTDKNHDGTLAQGEYVARPLESWLVQLDVNNDNRMSLSEYSAGNPSLVRNGRVRRVFSAIDRDGDATISIEEFADRPQEALFGKGDANADGELSFQEFAVGRQGPEEMASAKKQFAQKDSDGDGSLSFKEYAFRGEDDEFWKADKNGDGRLDPGEFSNSPALRTAGNVLVVFRLLDTNGDDTVCLAEFRDSTRPDAAGEP